MSPIRVWSGAAAILALWCGEARAFELCDGADNDSDGVVDEGCGIGCGVWSSDVRAEACALRMPLGSEVDTLSGHAAHGPVVDVAVAAPGPAIVVARTWSSGWAYTHQQGSTNGSLGAGWRHTFEENTTQAGTIGSSDVKLYRGDGSVDVFEWNSGTSSFKRPRRTRRFLQYVSSEYRVTKEDGSIWVYDPATSGRLIRVESPGGQTATVTYFSSGGASPCNSTTDAGRLCQVAFPYSRSLRFTYKDPPSGSAGRVLDEVRLHDGTNTETLVTYTYATTSSVVGLLRAEYRDDRDLEYTYVKPTGVGTVLLHKDFGLGTSSNLLLRTRTYDTSGRLDLFDTKGSEFRFSYGGGSTILEDLFNDRSHAVDFSGDVATGVSNSGKSNYSWLGTKEITWSTDKNTIRSIKNQRNVCTTYRWSDDAPQWMYRNDSDCNPDTTPTAANDVELVKFTSHPRLDLRLSTTRTSVFGAGVESMHIMDFAASLPSCSPLYTCVETDFNVNPGRQLRRIVHIGRSKDVAGSTTYFADVTTYTYDADGRVSQVDGPRTDVTDTTTMTYHSATDSNLTRRGRLHEQTIAAGALNLVTKYTGYHLLGGPTTTEDPNGATTTLAYDDMGRITSGTVPGGATTSMSYNADGTEAWKELPLNNAYTFAYDSGTGLPTRAYKRADKTDTSDTADFTTRTEFTYNAKNQMEKQRYQTRGSATSTRWVWGVAFDAEYRAHREYVYRADDTASDATQYFYDENGNVKSLADPSTATVSGATESDATDRYTRDALDRVTVVERKVAGTWTTLSTTTYNSRGWVTSLADSEGRTRSWTYDDAGLVLTAAGPDASTVTNVYGNAGLLVQTRKPGPVDITYTYDALGRTTLVNYPSGTTDLQTTYDSVTAPTQTNCRTGTTVTLNNLKGRLARVIDASGTVWYSYGSNGSLTFTARKYTWESCLRVTEFTYDANGNILTMRYPTGRLVTTTYAYTNDPDVATSMTVSYSGGSQTILSGADPYVSGGVSTWTHGNGTIAEQTSFMDGLPKTVRVVRSASDSSAILDLKYPISGYDAVGNLLTIEDETNPLRDLSYTYDDLHRIKTAQTAAHGASTTSGSAFGREEYGYSTDEMFNRTGITEYAEGSGFGTIKGYTYTGGTNKLASTSTPNAESFTYDSEGAVTAIVAGSITHTLTYDDAERVVAYDKTGASGWDYRYDSNGWRTTKEGTTYTDFYYLGTDLLAEVGPYTTFPAPMKEYIYFQGRLVAVVKSKLNSNGTTTDEEILHLHTDHLTTPQLATDANGTVVWRAAYKPFGERVVGPTERRTISGCATPNPYSNASCTPSSQPGCGVVWDSNASCAAGALKWAGAARVRIKFTSFNTQVHNDQGRVYDAGTVTGSRGLATYTGNLGTFWSDWFETDAVRVQLLANNSTTSSGFTISEMEAQFTPRPTASTPSLTQMPHTPNYPNHGSCTTQACGLIWDSGNLTVSGAARVRLYLENFETERDWDRARIYNGAGVLQQELSGSLGTDTTEANGGTGVDGGLWTTWVTGNTIKVQLWADSIINAYGFDVTRIEADFGATHVINLGFPGQYYDSESELVYNGARYYYPKTGRYLQTDPAGDASQYAYAGLRPSTHTDRSGRRPEFAPANNNANAQIARAAILNAATSATGNAASLSLTTFGVVRGFAIVRALARVAAAASVTTDLFSDPAALNASTFVPLAMRRVPNPGIAVGGSPIGTAIVTVHMDGAGCVFPWVNGWCGSGFTVWPDCRIGNISICPRSDGHFKSPGLAQACTYMHETGHSCGLGAFGSQEALADDFAAAFAPGFGSRQTQAQAGWPGQGFGCLTAGKPGILGLRP